MLNDGEGVEEIVQQLLPPLNVSGPTEASDMGLDCIPLNKENVQVRGLD